MVCLPYMLPPTVPFTAKAGDWGYLCFPDLKTKVKNGELIIYPDVSKSFQKPKLHFSKILFYRAWFILHCHLWESGLIAIVPGGQITAQAPQPTHFSPLTTGTAYKVPCFVSIVTAS